MKNHTKSYEDRNIINLYNNIDIVLQITKLFLCFRKSSDIDCFIEKEFDGTKDIRELISYLKTEKNPVFISVQEDIAKKCKVEADCVVIKKIWIKYFRNSNAIFSFQQLWDRVHPKDGLFLLAKKRFND